MEWEKWMSFTARSRGGKRHLKDAPDNYRNLLGSWFLEYQSTRRNNQRTRVEANGRRVCRPTNRREASPIARRYSLRHYHDLIMSSSFEFLNLAGFAFSISLTRLPIAGVNIFEMSYLANQGFLLIRHLRWRAIYLLSWRARNVAYFGRLARDNVPLILKLHFREKFLRFILHHTNVLIRQLVSYIVRESGNRMSRRKGWQTQNLLSSRSEKREKERK